MISNFSLLLEAYYACECRYKTPRLMFLSEDGNMSCCVKHLEGQPSGFWPYTTKLNFSHLMATAYANRPLFPWLGKLFYFIFVNKNGSSDRSCEVECLRTFEWLPASSVGHCEFGDLIYPLRSIIANFAPAKVSKLNPVSVRAKSYDPQKGWSSEKAQSSEFSIN